MYVFSNGVLEVIGTSESENSKIASAEVSLSDKSVLLVANAAPIVDFQPGTPYETVLAALSVEYNFESTEKDALSMNSIPG